MRIAPRTLLCATVTRLGGSGVDSGFDDLRDLCAAAGDQRSLAIGTAGQLMEHFLNMRWREASRLADELVGLLEAVDDPNLTVALLGTAMSAKQETAEMAEVLRLAELAIAIAGGDATKGSMMTGSPLALATALRGLARWSLGLPGWRSDFDPAVAMARAVDPVTRAAAIYFTYVVAIVNGVVLPTADLLPETAETLAIAQQSGQGLALAMAQHYRGIVLVHDGGRSTSEGLELLERARDTALHRRYALNAVPQIDTCIALERTRRGDLEAAVELSRPAVERMLGSGCVFGAAPTTYVLVDALVQQGGADAIAEARAAIERLATVPTDPRYVVNEIWLLRMRALLARTQGEDAAYRDYRDRYRAMATSLGFEGHMQWAEAMP